MARSDDVHFTIDEAELRRTFKGGEFRRVAETAGLTILGHAIPHSGVDYGDLVNSMGYAVVAGDDGVLEVILGSNPETGAAVPYAAANWAGPEFHNEFDEPMIGPRRPRKKRPHEIKDVPTTPWGKALRELGIQYTREPGMPEV